jgi:sirohydrochlorin ferrochelatase
MNKDTIIHALGFCSAALIGWSVPQFTVVGTVAAHETKIGELAARQSEEVDNRKAAVMVITASMSDDRVHTDKAMTELLVHLDKVIDQNTALMAELKSQGR